MKRYGIPSLHEQGRVPQHVVVSDYHPLTQPEIAELLQAARQAGNAGDGRTLASIQVRFDQAIEGMTSPRPLTGPVAQALNAVDKLFATRWQQGPDPELVCEFSRLMQWKSRANRAFGYRSRIEKGRRSW